MINYKEQYNKVENTYKELEKEFKVFKKKISYENRCNLKLKINQHREAINKLVSSIDNIFLK